MKKTQRNEKAKELAAIKRVLKLASGYISVLNQDQLVAWDGGMMTWGELKNQLDCASKLSVFRKQNK